MRLRILCGKLADAVRLECLWWSYGIYLYTFLKYLIRWNLSLLPYFSTFICLHVSHNRKFVLCVISIETQFDYNLLLSGGKRRIASMDQCKYPVIEAFFSILHRLFTFIVHFFLILPLRHLLIFISSTLIRWEFLWFKPCIIIIYAASQLEDDCVCWLWHRLFNGIINFITMPGSLSCILILFRDVGCT